MSGTRFQLAPLALAAALAASFIGGAAATVLVSATSQTHQSAPGAVPAAGGFSDGSYDRAERIRGQRDWSER